MDWFVGLMLKRWGKMKRNKPPLTFIGIEHQFLSPTHLLCHQAPYLKKLKPIALAKSRLQSPNKLCNAKEHFDFRSNVCSMLWLCLTRVDLISDVTQLQQVMVSPTVSDIKRANAALKKAKDQATLAGIHFRRLQPPLRLVAVSDSSHLTKLTVYAQEARMVLLMSDKRGEVGECGEWISPENSAFLEGQAHTLYATGKKSTRVSHSTSHAECLALLGCSQVATLIANRFTEPFLPVLFGIRAPKPLDILRVQDRGLLILPVDGVTDCMDAFELVCNSKGLSSDTTQRAVVLSLRELRLRRSLRRIYHFPTCIMLADGLTKVGKFFQLLRFSSCGIFSLDALRAKGLSIRFSESPPWTAPRSATLVPADFDEDQREIDIVDQRPLRLNHVAPRPGFKKPLGSRDRFWQ